MENLNHFVVLYREQDQPPLDVPLGFQCWADDADHAEEQCVNAYPDCDVLWVFEGTYQGALNDYYHCCDWRA